ncbi:MAG: CvpA family protein [Cryomorphaceae bacterium]|nr:CvpA family protein [Cryomorphaceae bacterium]
MNALDLLLILPPVLVAIYGYRKGFFKQLFSLGALIIALVVGIVVNRNFLRELYNQENVDYFHANMFAVVLVMIIALVIFLYLGRLMRAFLQRIRLGFLDTLLGAIFGLAKGLLISLIMVFFIQALSINAPTWQTEARNNSRLLPVLDNFNRIGLMYLLGEEEFDFKEVLPEQYM